MYQGKVLTTLAGHVADRFHHSAGWWSVDDDGRRLRITITREGERPREPVERPRFRVRSAVADHGGEEKRMKAEG